MDGEDVKSAPSFGEIFTGQLPYYLHLGMTADEYWEGDPFLCVSFRKAYEFKRVEENQKAWWNGYYNYLGFAIAITNAFSDKGKKEKYPEKPFEINKKEETQEEINRRVIEKLKARFAIINKEFTDGN